MLSGREVLIHFSLQYEGNWDAIYNAIKNKESIEEPYDTIKEKINNIKSKVVTILDSDYPEDLKHIRMCPFVLYYYGDLSLVRSISHNVAVVGSRENSPYGKSITISIVEELCKNYRIVSGLARGIDGIAHKATLEHGGKTIAVLGSGIDYCYPMENEKIYKEIKENHLLISEYPSNTRPEKDNFPIRNRLIVAFSKGVVVPEAKSKSGTMITINYAVEAGKEVMCIPERAGEESACNSLIKQGASLVENAQDIEYCLSSYWPEKNEKNLK